MWSQGAAVAAHAAQVGPVAPQRGHQAPGSSGFHDDSAKATAGGGADQLSQARSTATARTWHECTRGNTPAKGIAAWS
jgi:hypothetical protein